MPTPLFNELVLMFVPSLMYSFLALTAVCNSSKELTVVHSGSAALAVTPVMGTIVSSIISTSRMLTMRLRVFVFVISFPPSK